MWKFYCSVILQIIFVLFVSGRSLDEVLWNMDNQISLYNKQLPSQIPDLSEPFHNWFFPTDETQKPPQVLIPQKMKNENELEQGQSYQGNNAPPSWMTQNQNNILSWMNNPSQNQPSYVRITTTKKAIWNQNANTHPTPIQNNQHQNFAPAPIQQQFTISHFQNIQQPLLNHQTQAPVVLNTVSSSIVPTSIPKSENQQNSNNSNQIIQFDPNIQKNTINQPNLNNQVNINQHIPVTQNPILNRQTTGPNLMITEKSDDQVTNSAHSQFTASAIQITTPSNLIQQRPTLATIQNTVPSGIIQQTIKPDFHITDPVIQNSQQPIMKHSQGSTIFRTQPTLPSWLAPAIKPIIIVDTSISTSHPIFTAPIISRTQQHTFSSTQSPLIQIAPQITINPFNPQVPTAPSVTNFSRLATTPSITRIPQFPSLNLFDLHQTLLNQLQNNQSIQDILKIDTNSQGISFPTYTAPIFRKTQPPTNVRQNQLPRQNLEFTIPVSRTTTTMFPGVPIITRPSTPTTTFPRVPIITTPSTPTVGLFSTTARPLFPIIPITKTTGRPNWHSNIGQTTTTRSSIFPSTTTWKQNLIPITTRSPLIPNIPQTPIRPVTSTIRSTVPTNRPPFATPRPPQVLTRPPVVSARTTTKQPQKMTTKEVSRTTQTQEIRIPLRNQQSINDILKLTDNMLSSLNNQIWQSISRIG
ncbi:mucin-2-like [Chironomus tepperi]|uniref:mucin-2-like n=1 Tax=Chironomus tepperi TaxID=113505 RepID=UPI00391F50E8